MSLETELRDLALHLDHPAGDGLADAVRREAGRAPSAGAPAVRGRRRRRFVAVAVAAALTVAILVPLAWSRLTGRSDSDVAGPPTTATTAPRPTTTTTTLPAVLALGLDEARAAVEFPIRLPQGLDAPEHVIVDRRVPGGLVALRYPAFTLVELPTPANSSVAEVTSADAASETFPMTVRGQPALWITGGAPEIGFVDRDRALRRSPTRAGGNVLVWVEDGITYRIEGFAYQSSAMAMANSMV